MMKAIVGLGSNAYTAKITGKATMIVGWTRARTV